jgi:hypothetical protein
MNDFTNPLDNVQIASPCSSDWNQMYGDQRKRFCSECSLNVYNLSDMTREEAENFLLMSEGRVCVQIFRRNDGTLLTQNCPTGSRVWKNRVSKTVTAALSLCIAFVAGTGLKLATDSLYFKSQTKPAPAKADKDKISFTITRGILANLVDVKSAILRDRGGSE